MKIQVKLYAKLAQMDENNNFKTVLFDNLEHAIEASEYYYNNYFYQIRVIDSTGAIYAEYEN